eukprot:COSAG06_NODE_5285_length_3586_cov_1.936909_3_plen_162_part_00
MLSAGPGDPVLGVASSSSSSAISLRPPGPGRASMPHAAAAARTLWPGLVVGLRREGFGSRRRARLLREVACEKKVRRWNSGDFAPAGESSILCAVIRVCNACQRATHPPPTRQTTHRRPSAAAGSPGPVSRESAPICRSESWGASCSLVARAGGGRAYSGP